MTRPNGILAVAALTLAILAGCGTADADPKPAASSSAASPSPSASPSASPVDTGPTCKDFQQWAPEVKTKWVADKLIELVGETEVASTISGYQQLGFSLAIERACLSVYPDNPSVDVLAKVEYEANKDEYVPKPGTP